MATSEGQPHHTPVLLDEVVQQLLPPSCPPRARLLLVDGTVGGGGHSRALLDAAGTDTRLIGLDWDDRALAAARRNLEAYGDRVRLVRENFAELPAVLRHLDEPEASAAVIFLDLGLSALHVEDAERGFSFTREGPLDMRMDTRQTTTAADLVARLDEKALAEVFYRYGGERKSRAIAAGICRARKQAPILSTTQLAAIVTRAARVKARQRLHPATRTFQALRMAVNQEQENIEQGIPAAAGCLAPEGRLGVVSFHSGEDRIIKVNFKRLAATGQFEIVTKKPIVPSVAERKRNRRALISKFRVLKRVN